MPTAKSTQRSINRKLSELERQLERKLTSFYRKKIKPFASSTTAETLKQKHDGEIRGIIRKTVEDSYLVGTDLVGKKIRVEIPEFQLFISVTDARNISQLTNDMSNQFWRTVNRLVIRENEYKLNLKTSELDRRNPFDDKAAMIGISAFVAYSAYNNAVVSKTNIINQPSTFDLEIGFDVQRIGGKVQWVTAQDERVCTPQTNHTSPCEPYDGQIFDSNIDLIPEIPRHKHCRCTLIPLIE